MNQLMFIVIGYIAQYNHSNCTRFLMMYGIDRLKGFSNFAKTPKIHAPGYRIFGKCLEDGGASWTRTIQILANNLSLIFEHPNISGCKDYEALTCAVSKVQKKRLSQLFETSTRKQFPSKTHPSDIHIGRVYSGRFVSSLLPLPGIYLIKYLRRAKSRREVC